MTGLTPRQDDSVGTPLEGDDLFQDAVVRAFEKLHTLRDETRFRPWFYAVLLSLHRTRSRWGFWKRFLSLEASLEGGFDPAGEDGRDREVERQRSLRVSRALATLSAVQREAIVLHDLDGFSLEEIAQMQDVSLSAVKSRVSRGRAKMRRHYERLELASAHGSSTKTDPVRVVVRRTGQTVL